MWSGLARPADTLFAGTSTISIILFVLLILVGIVILTVLPTQDLEKYAVAVREFVQRLADQLPPSLKAAVAKSEL